MLSWQLIYELKLLHIYAFILKTTIYKVGKSKKKKKKKVVLIIVSMLYQDTISSKQHSGLFIKETARHSHLRKQPAEYVWFYYPESHKLRVSGFHKEAANAEFTTLQNC